MAITFTGTCNTGVITSMIGGESVLAIECSLRSKVKVDIIGIRLSMSSTASTTATGNVMPIFRMRKFVGSTEGGLALSGKAPFDTAQASDAGVIVRQSPGKAGESATGIVITGTPVTMMQAMGTRNTTLFGQELMNWPEMIWERLPGSHLYLAPGEVLAVTWDDGTQPAGGDAILDIMWEEDSLGTEYTISGAVTLADAAVSGAKVLVVTDLDRDLPAPQMEVITTGAPGTWSKTLAAGVKASVFVQSRTGETLYTSDGKPYIAKP